MNINVIKAPDASKPFAIIDKPSNLPSAPLTSDDKNNAFYEAACLFPQLLNVHGKKEIEHGLLHRLDTATSGLMIIAADQACYDFLQDEQQQGKIIKTYRARCKVASCILDGFPAAPVDIKKIEKDSCFEISSCFRPYGPGHKEVRPVTMNSGKAALKKLGKAVVYTTKIQILELDKENSIAEVECKITNGYRHQVRCHLAWCGLAIMDDNIYNCTLKNESAEPMKFCATGLCWVYPRGDLNSYDRKDTWT